MNPTKEDLTCPFHSDLEVWMKQIDNKLSKLLRWKATVIGYTSGIFIVIVIVFKLIEILK